MNCPKCNSMLEQVRLEAVRVDRCPSCGGTWYDRNELRVLKDRESHGDYCWIDLDLWRDADRFRARRQERYACPRDGQSMTTVHYGESKVVIDICSKCQGIWLDKAEYDEILRYLERVVDSSTAGDYLGDMRHEVAEMLRLHEGPLDAMHDLSKIVYLLELRFCANHPDLAANAARTIPKF